MWKDSETRIDFLDFDYLKEIIKEIIKNENLNPSTIGVYGDWGSGKSSLIEMVIEELEREENILCLKFNGWLFEGYEEAKTSFMGSVLDEISERKGLDEKIKEKLKNLYKNIDLLKIASFGIKHGIDYLLSGGTGTLLSLLTSQLKNKVKNASEEDISTILKGEVSSKKLRKSILEFREEFGKLLKEAKINRLVIFIDELDRCSSETILETFEAMRLFLFTENTSFIIGADERHIEHAVKQKFKGIEENGINLGKEYLEKIIQYPVKIPQLGRREMVNYIIYLFLYNQLEEEEFIKLSNIFNEEKKKKKINFEITNELISEYDLKISEKVKEILFLARTLGPILSDGLKGNPRHCKRFLNALSMREKMGEYKGIKLERNILGKLMILEYFNQSYFRELPKFLDKNGKIQELEVFEMEGEIGKRTLEVLEVFRDNENFKKWAQLEPKISDIDIRPYLYFTRDTLHNFGTLSYRLSENAKDALESLLSGSTAKVKHGFEILSNISIGEVDYIYNELIKKLFSKGERLEGEKVKILIKYCSIRKEKEDEFIKLLNDIPGEKVTAGVIPHLSKHFKDENIVNKGTNIFNKWREENIKLNGAIAKQLEFMGGGIKNGNI